MSPARHVVASAAAGGFAWLVSGNPVSVPVALAGGVLPDVDHFLDYYVRYIRRNGRYTIYLLHGWEYLLAGTLLFLFSQSNDWVLAVILGYLTHLLGDQVFNKARWHTYFLIARTVFRFRSASIVGAEGDRAAHAIVSAAPFGKRRIAEWLDRHSPDH